MVKNLPASAGDIKDVSSIPVSGRSPGEGKIYPLYSPWSCKESDMAEATEYDACLLPFSVNYCPLTYPRNPPRTLRPVPVSLGGSVSASFKRAVVRN